MPAADGFELNGKVAIVTGASAGIGRASAQALAAAGASVVVADVDAEGGAETVELIERSGRRAKFVRADVADPVSVEAMVASTLQAFGRLDFAHNNAGVAAETADVADYSIDEWDRVTGVMLRGVFLCMKYEIPAILAAGGGAIVNTASGAGLVGYPSQSPYVASKHGVIGLTKTAALEYGKRGIRINAVCPGTVWSPMVDKAINDMPGLDEHLVNLHPIGRIGRAEEIADAVVWLCSERSTFVMGHALSVDGGYVIH